MKKAIVLMLVMLCMLFTACKPSMALSSVGNEDSILIEITDETQSTTVSDFDECVDVTEDTVETEYNTEDAIVESEKEVETTFDPTELVIDKQVNIGYRTESQYANRFTEEYRLYLEQISGYEVAFLPFEGSVDDIMHELNLRLISGNTPVVPDILVDFPLYGTDHLKYVIMDFTDYFADPEKSAVFWRVLDSCATEAHRSQIL